MRISIISPNMQLSDRLRRDAEQKLNIILERISNRIHHVSITLTDENGLRGGVDKLCRANVSVRGLGTVTTKSQRKNVLRSIDEALRRARRVILKRLKRREARSRKQAEIVTVAEFDQEVAIVS